MKIHIDENGDYKDTEITIHCRQVDEEVYETPLKLYELEEQLGPKDFFRANKSCIIICFGISFGVMVIKTKHEDKTYERLLKEYKERKEKE